VILKYLLMFDEDGRRWRTVGSVKGRKRDAEWVTLYGIMKRRRTRFGGDILITVVDW